MYQAWVAYLQINMLKVIMSLFMLNNGSTLLFKRQTASHLLKENVKAIFLRVQIWHFPNIF